MRADLERRFWQAEHTGRLVVARSDADARRLRAGVERGELLSPAVGTFARAAVFAQLKPDQRALCVIRALADIHQSWVFCGISAALVHGLSVSFSLIGNAHVATSRAARTRDSRGIERHVIAEARYEVVDGIKVTPLPRTVFDCLRQSDFRCALAIADSALRTSSMTCDDLLAIFEGMSGRFERRQRALDIMALGDGRAESGGESVARAVMIERGFRLPELQRVMVDPISGKARRVDFFWEQQDRPNVIGELDGREKYLSESMTHGRSAVEVMADERLRESRISLSGARIMRFSYAQATNGAFFTRLLSSFGVPRDAHIPAVAVDPNDDEARLRCSERLLLSRRIERQSVQRLAAASNGALVSTRET